MNSQRKTLAFCVAVAIAFASGFAADSAHAAYRAGEVIVKYKSGAVRTRSTMDGLYNAAGVRKISRYRGLMQGFEQLFLKPGVRVEDAIAQLQRDPTVEYAQPNYIVYSLPIQQTLRLKRIHPNDGIPCIPGMDIPGCDKNAPIPCLIPGLPFPPGCQDPGNDDPSPDPGPAPTPDPTSPPATRPALQPAPADVTPPVADPALAKAYGLAKIGADEAWKITRGSKTFIVADIDTGIDYNHEDLAFNVWRNPNPTDKNDVAGYDFVHDDGLPYDDNEHGTHTAGTIGAVGGNGIGVSGVSQRVSLMALKFLSGDGSGTTADAVKAVDYAIAHGAKVLSNSWGGPADDGNQALKDAIDRAKAKNVLFIAAAGNDSKNDDDPTQASYPAGFDNDNLISVAATDENDDLAFFSNYGAKTVQVAAPGVNVYSTQPGNKYQQLSGTSMACPHVAGAAALLWSRHPSWDYKKVKQVLMDTVDKLPALAGKTVTGGRINLAKALRSTE